MKLTSIRSKSCPKGRGASRSTLSSYRGDSLREQEMSDTDVVLYEVRGKVSYVTLNRPDKLNAISPQLRDRAVEVLHQADDDPATRVVVLRGAGRSFCVGYDIGGTDPEKATWRHDALKWHSNLSRGIKFEMTPWDLRKPVIASVQGHAVGGGCELMMFCDLVIAADDTKFGEPEVRFSDTGPGFVMPFLIGMKRAKELLYMGDMIDAKTALDYGMINRVVPLAELSAATAKYADRMALIDTETLAWTKLALNRGAEAAGFRNAILAGLDVIAPLYSAKTESGGEFERIRKEQGLGAALKWRREQFKALP
ncbi:MAG: enoyl-CoA hydratase/isomerase family protein [Alphaproteobacteria bacterium]|nr:enoyl-CoA hydratase/isomerase family protein [Alphaproteobacteria bacterium]